MATDWKPSGSWRKKFRQALDEAFDENTMQLLIVDYFSPKSFAKVAPVGLGSTFESRLLQLIETARMEDWLQDLVVAAHERRPRNAAIGELASQLGLTATGPRLDNDTGRPLEALIQDNARFLTLSVFYERLPILEGQVCWVDIPGGGCTGFLVGPNLVLTNQHVIARITSGAARPQDTRCLFDYREPVDDSTLQKKGTQVELAQAWLVDSRPPSQYDSHPDLGDAAPGEIDAALIRLAEPIGEDPVGGDTADPQAQPRGWMWVGANVAPLSGGNQVFLLQHPKGGPLRLSVGAVTGFNDAGTRIRYDANSRDGSSGSPLFDADLNLVALHHAFDPTHHPPAWNQGVPISLVQQVWADTLQAPPEGG